MLAPYFRRKSILTLLEQHEVMSVVHIAEALGVSVSTARRDINLMLEDGTIEKKRGGAFCIKAEPQNISRHPIALYEDHSESGPKTMIAQKAAKLVSDGDIIFIDSGTTTGKMVQFITAKNVTVVTTNLSMVQNYLPIEGITFILLGGEYVYDFNSVNGPLAETQISSMHFNKAFLGANAYSLEEQCTYVYDIREASIKQLVKNHSARCYLLAEHAKESRIVFFKSFDLFNCTIINEDTDESKLI